jgi:hypothetical protein
MRLAQLPISAKGYRAPGEHGVRRLLGSSCADTNYIERQNDEKENWRKRMISSMIVLLIIAGVSIVLCRLRVWLICFFLPLNAYLAYDLISELYGPSTYDSLVADFGNSIIVYCWAVATVLVISPIIGTILRIRKKRARMQRREIAV